MGTKWCSQCQDVGGGGVPEDALRLGALQPEHLLCEGSDDPGQPSVRKPVPLDPHHLLERAAVHTAPEYLKLRESRGSAYTA